MSFLSFLDKALEQLAAHPADAHTAEITRSALRMKALYAELDARASAGDRSAASASAPTPDLPPLHRLSGSESGVDSTLEFSRPLHRTVAGSGGELARSEAHARHPSIEAGLGEARGRQPTAPAVEVVKPECDYPDCGCGPDCFVYLKGQCGEPQEMLPGMDTDGLKLHAELYGPNVELSGHQRPARKDEDGTK